MANSQTSLAGKVCLLTGTSSGIGKATAHGLAALGATIVMVVRDPSRGEIVRREIIQRSGNQSIDLLSADLSSQASIRQLVEQFKQKYSQLHVLINNAGVFNLNRRKTVDGLEMTFAVNQLAPFLLTNLLLDVVKASVPARIINVGSSAHTNGYIQMDDLQSARQYGPMRAYGQSKLALLLFSYRLARLLEGTGVTVNCLHPGFVGTNIAQNNFPAFIRPVTRFLVSLPGISPEEGAETSLYLASSPEVEDVTGKYFVYSHPKRTIPISHDEALQQSLWDECARLVHLASPEDI